MIAYILRRLLLVVPTFFAIITINFFIIQLAPGGPVDQYIANQAGIGDANVMQDRLGGGSSDLVLPTDSTSEREAYRGGHGLTAEEIAEIEKRFGFDKPIGERFWNMLVDYATFDFGESLFRGKSVVDLIIERIPVSISLGLWSTLIIYSVSIPLGIKKAIKEAKLFGEVEVLRDVDA